MKANQIGQEGHLNPAKILLDWPLLNLPLLLMVLNTFGPKTVCEGVIPNRGYPEWPLQNTSLHRHGQYSWSKKVCQCVIQTGANQIGPFRTYPSIVIVNKLGPN